MCYESSTGFTLKSEDFQLTDFSKTKSPTNYMIYLLIV